MAARKRGDASKNVAGKKNSHKKSSAAKKTGAKKKTSAAEKTRPQPSAKSKGVERIKRRPPSGTGVRSMARVTDANLPPWAVSPEQIRILDDAGLGRLMRALLVEQAYRSRADVSKVSVNTEGKAADDGCDGWTPGPPASDRWLADVDTCWQLKAGGAGQPAKLVGEVEKKIPVATLRAGGRFVAVTSRAGGGRREETSRLEVLTKGAKKAGLSKSRIEVLTSETLTSWVNEHPAIAAAIRGMPLAWTLERWGKDSLHKDPWQSTSSLEAQLSALRSSLDFATDATLHVHVYGQPGAGKTRFVLEACRDAPWAGSVMYIPQAADSRIGDLLDSVAGTDSARLVLVVDEVLPTQVSGFNAHVRTAGGRIRLITIGHEGSPDSTNIEETRIESLDEQTMAKVIAGWHPELPTEHVQFVIAFSDGFVKLARLTASAVARDKSTDTSQLLARNDIRQLMDALLGKAERRRALHVLAMLTSVGWTGQRAAEGEAIAKHFGLDWDDVKAEVEAMHAKHGIAPRGGDLRYISPKPLGVYLALEALTLSPEKFRSLPDALPNEAARSAYYDRLRSVIASPIARAFAEQELARFSKWNDFAESPAVERWAALAGADPEGAARAARRALEGATHDERLAIAGGARRHLVRALVQLAWRAAPFTDAVLGLAELSEAENESWANNATGEFLSKYQLELGGTERPYLERLEVIDHLLQREAPYRRLAVAALAKVAGTNESRIGGPPAEGTPAAPEWRLPTHAAWVECAHEALDRLTAVATAATVDIGDALLRAVRNLALLLRNVTVREDVARFVRAVPRQLPNLREQVRGEVYRVLHGEKKYWKKLHPDDVAWLERLHREFEDTSLSGRLRQALAVPAWDRSNDDQAKLDALASVLVAQPEALAGEWSWLTRGDVGVVWDLGEALGRADSSGLLLKPMLTFNDRGPDSRVIAAYLHERAKHERAGWLDDQIDEVDAASSEDSALVFDLTWRCAPTTRGAERLTRYARSNRLQPAMVAKLEFGGWSLGPEIGALVTFIRSLLAHTDLRVGALGLVEQRLSKAPEDLPLLESVAAALVTDLDVLRAAPMNGYDWAQVARKLLPAHARAIARTVFACQARRDGDGWFVEHSEASDILAACVQSSPADVWTELQPHLESEEWYLFVVGFPSGVLSRLPRADLLEWVADAPDRRPGVLARLVEKTFSDGTLGAELLHRYGTHKDVADSFFSAYVTGSWSGPASQHWERRAAQLETTASTSTLLGVRNWARDAAAKLRRMAEADRKREEERRLRFP